MTVSSNPQGPLSVGNVVSAGLQLYSNHFKQYFGVAVRATLWALLPFVGLLAVGIGAAVLQIQNPGLIALLVPVWLVLAIYCIGKYMTGSAAIARLAFGELTNQPESTVQASRFTNSRLWAFWRVALLMGLLYGALILGVYLALAVVFVAVFAGFGGFAGLGGTTSPDVNPALVIVLVLLGVLLIAGILLLLSWFAARFAVAELPLAVETAVKATQSIGRSWQLTQKSAWRVMLILFITFLITIPLQILVQVVTSIAQAALVTVMAEASTEFNVILLAATYAVGLVAGVIVLPLWQTIKAVIYYDLRSRREGLGLQLPDRPV